MSHFICSYLQTNYQPPLHRQSQLINTHLIFYFCLLFFVLGLWNIKRKMGFWIFLIFFTLLIMFIWICIYGRRYVIVTHPTCSHEILMYTHAMINIHVMIGFDHFSFSGRSQLWLFSSLFLLFFIHCVHFKGIAFSFKSLYNNRKRKKK